MSVWGKMAITVVITAVVAGFGTYYFVHNRAVTDETNLQDQVSALTTKINGLEKNTTSTSTSTSTPTQSTAGSTPVPLATTTMPAAPEPTVISACLTANLSVALVPQAGGGTAGTYYYNLVLTNNGIQSCTITGSPTISAVNSAGTVVGQTEVGVHTSKTITIAIGEKAYSTVGFPDAGNFNPSTCKAMTSLMVYPPSQQTALTIANINTYNSSFTSEFCQPFSVTDFTTTAQG